jgi:glycerophosphoryl diester phosphodiesterase
VNIPFEVVAHRGVRTHADANRMAPENTLPAFEEAARLNASIELDVIATRDGRLIVHHDDKTGRMFHLPNGDKRLRVVHSKEVDAATFNQAGHEATVRQMLGPEADYQTPEKYQRVGMPELPHVLKALPDTHIYAELKTYDTEVLRSANNNLEERMVKLIQANDLYDRVTVISFSPLSLRRVKKLDTRIRTGLDFHLPALIKALPWLMRPFITLYIKKWVGADSMHPCYEETSPRMVHLARQAGLPIVPWVNNQTRSEEKKLFPTLIGMGVNGLITNAVDLLQEAVTQQSAAAPQATARQAEGAPTPKFGQPFGYA